MKRSRRLAAFAAAAAIFALPTSAQAYVHTGQCSPLSQGVLCLDSSGQTYNPWVYVEGNIAPETREYVCAGGRTSAGNWRTGSGCNYRSAQQGGTDFRRSNLSSATPESRAIVWWDSGPAASAVNYETLRAGT